MGNVMVFFYYPAAVPYSVANEIRNTSFRAADPATTWLTAAASAQARAAWATTFPRAVVHRPCERPWIPSPLARTTWWPPIVNGTETRITASRLNLNNCPLAFPTEPRKSVTDRPIDPKTDIPISNATTRRVSDSSYLMKTTTKRRMPRVNPAPLQVNFLTF